MHVFSDTTWTFRKEPLLNIFNVLSLSTCVTATCDSFNTFNRFFSAYGTAFAVDLGKVERLWLGEAGVFGRGAGCRR